MRYKWCQEQTNLLKELRSCKDIYFPLTRIRKILNYRFNTNRTYRSIVLKLAELENRTIEKNPNKLKNSIDFEDRMFIITKRKQGVGYEAIRYNLNCRYSLVKMRNSVYAYERKRK